MRLTTIALALALAPAWATAQHSDHSANAAAPMKTACPLHAKDLGLTPLQDTAFAKIRAAHMAEMAAVHERLGAPPMMMHGAGAKPDSAEHAKHHAAMTPAMRAALDSAMKASMSRAVDAARATLGDAQRARFDAAVAAHAAEKKEREAKGMPHACGDCCAEHGKAG